MRRNRIAAAAIAALLALAPGLSLAGSARAAGGSGGQSPLTSTSGSLGGGITAPPGTTATSSGTATSANTSTTGGGGGISAGAAIAIAVAAVLIIGGIAVAIFRDARRRTRGRHAPSVDADRVPGSKRPPKARKLSPGERRRRKRGRAPRRR